jgi:prevent-host-death family protein
MSDKRQTPSLQVPPDASREVTVRELSRATGSVLEEVSAGKRVVVTRHGNPVALILAIDDAIDVFLAHAEEFVRMRLAAREELDRSDRSP